MADEQGAIPEGMKAWTVWDAEARMAREGDWRGVAYSISHDILPVIPEGSGEHAYRERAWMQIKAADRLLAAIEAATPKPPVDAGAMRERCARVAENATPNVVGLVREVCDRIAAAIRNLPDAGEPL